MIRGAARRSPGARMKLAQHRLAARARASEARALLEDCDLVFVSGGDVDLGMKVLHDRDMAAPLGALARAGKPMFGISAGSLMLAREWVRFPDDDEDARPSSSRASASPPSTSTPTPRTTAGASCASSCASCTSAATPTPWATG